MTKIKFEDKIKELESIINELENGEINLDDMVSKYTKAMKLINECDSELKNIEKKVNFIVNNDNDLEEFEISE